MGRDYYIESPIDRIKDRLHIHLHFPIPMDKPDCYKALAVVHCNFFSKNLYAFGVDEVQAFFLLQNPILAFLKTKVDEGYAIFWERPGDLSLDSL
jgi:hypothetical protein